jgi:hypothetical protein
LPVDLLQQFWCIQESLLEVRFQTGDGVKGARLSDGMVWPRHIVEFIEGHHF